MRATRAVSTPGVSQGLHGHASQLQEGVDAAEAVPHGLYRSSAHSQADHRPWARRGVRLWHLADIKAARLNVRFRALFGHQRVACLTDEKNPSGMSPRGVFRGNDIVQDLSKLDSRLISNASDNELGGIDDGKALGIVTALEIKRLVFGGVDMRDLSLV